ncbi:hypothetical protein [Paraburkholderia youngii]|uniref:hypothetical protein n=1 Tax=Paraburkholderia youngii TaxID=2782701 RepID=UPI003D1D9B05
MNGTYLRATANGYDAILKCLACGNTYLHQERIEAFERNADASIGLHITIEGGRAIVDNGLAGNPSSRRSGFKVYFSCESCAAGPVLSFSQHKGNTEITFD